jgi:hypothetical protein
MELFKEKKELRERRQGMEKDTEKRDAQTQIWF